MSLKIITSYKKDFYQNHDFRFDAKFFLIKQIFDLLEVKSICDVKTLDELKAVISSGSYIDSYIDKNKGIPYIRVGNIKPFNIDENESSFVYVSKELPEKIKVIQDDIIMGRTQATTDKLGVASIADTAMVGYVVSQHITRITINRKYLSPYYLVGYLNSKFYKAQTALATHGDTRVEMTHSQLKKVRIFIPSKEEVDKIESKVLSIIKYNRLSIEKILEAKKKLEKVLGFEDKKSEKKASYFKVNLSDINDFGIWNAKSHLPIYVNAEESIKKRFKTTTLGKITTIKKGIEVGSENYKTELLKKENDYAFIRTSDITNHEIDIYPDYFISEEIVKLLDYSDVHDGEIFFSKDGIIGETSIASEHDRVVVASGFARISLKKNTHNITPEYLFTLLSIKPTGYFPAIRRTVIASTIPHLREARLKEIEIPIIDSSIIQEITQLIKNAFILKDKKKVLLKEVRAEIDHYYNIINSDN